MGNFTMNSMIHNDQKKLINFDLIIFNMNK